MGRGQELLDAARKGDVRTVSKILALITKRSGPFTSLRRGAGVNVQDDNGYTPLHHACMNGHREIVHLLLSVDASPCVVDKKGATPLHLAAFKGDSHVVSMLLGHCNPPVNIDQKTNDEETALLFAAQFGFVDVVSQLITKGADVALKNNKDESPLDLAAQFGKLETVAQLINAKPQLIEPYRAPRVVFPTTPLHRATMNGHEEVVEYLIEAGVDPNIRTENGTALHEAVRYLRASVVQVLLEKGADLKAVDRRGNTAFALLAGYPKEATKKVRRVIKEYENHIKNAYESEEDLPPIPVHDYPSPVGGYVNAFGMGKAPETQKNTNINLSLSQSSSSLTKNHQSFVKKLASKCLGLKAKFNSAPNISNSQALDSDVSTKSPNPDHKSNTNTLLIGNSKFFNRILSKKEESGEIICNDEFDTISLDRLGTLNRDSSVNRSNRSCPGFKTSLPNISENAELSDSESVIITEIDCDTPKQQDPREAINLHAKLTIFEPRQRISSNDDSADINCDSADLVNECYEPCKFADNESDKINESNNNLPKPLPRGNMPILSNDNGIIYENVSVISKRDPPKPAVRNNVPSKLRLDEVQRKALYENVTVFKEKLAETRTNETHIVCKDNETNKLEKSILSRSSTLSSDSMEDESNLEDILLSEKSKSFRRGEKLVYSSKSEISRTQSNSSNVSEFTEASAIENVDCSEEIYTTMSGTLPHKTKNDPENKKKVLFRHKTFTNIEVDRNTQNLNTVPFDHYEFMKETLAHYHIRGTGHCIHKAPTVEEFIYIFNRETLYSDTPPFTLVPNNKRESYFETAICFCKPKVPKYHKSAEDLLQLSFDQEEENKVTIDVSALRARNEIVSTSFRCFCDSGQCTFHAKKRESLDNLIVKFSAVKRSISTPDITLDTSFSTVNRSNSMKNPSDTEIHYAVTNIEDIVLRNKRIATGNLESPIYTEMSQPSTLTSSIGQYSIKDIADVISLNSNSESINASPICALNSSHLPLRKSTSSEYSGRWTLASCNSNTTVKSDLSYKTCNEDPEEDSDDGTLHSDEDSSDAETVKSDVSTAKRPWVHSDSFNFGQSGPKIQNYAILEEDSNSSEEDTNIESPSKIESGISVGGSESSSSGCDEDSSIPGVDAESLGVASLERDAGCGGVRSGSGRRRWDEAEGTSEGDALSVSSAASSCAPHHLAHHHDYSKVSPTPPKKPPRRNLSVSPTHANSPSSGYSYELRAHARSQDDLDEIQGAKHYLKHGRSVDQYVDGKLSYSEFDENHDSPRVAPIPNPRPSLKNRSQPVAITAMYENVVIKEQNPRRKLRRNNFGPQDESRMEDRVRKYSNQDRSSLESLLDDQSINSPSDCERYYDGPRVDIPLSPTHYEQPPTPDHPPPSARQAENSIHERIRPLSQLIMEVVEEIRIRKKSEADVTENR